MRKQTILGAAAVSAMVAAVGGGLCRGRRAQSWTLYSWWRTSSDGARLW